MNLMMSLLRLISSFFLGIHHFQILSYWVILIFQESIGLAQTFPLVNLCDSVFLSQQVHRPTRKSNILDLIFCSNELINTLVVSDTFISDHRMITVETNIPVHGVAPKQISNPPSNKIAVFDFHKADWTNFCSIDWVTTLEPIPPSSCFYYFIDTLYHKCIIMFPLKIPVKPNSIYRERF